MTDIRDILRIPAREVTAVTRTLAGVDLKRIDSWKWIEQQPIALMIHTQGFFAADIICEMDSCMCVDIVSGMYGGGMPPKQETEQYLKEYMNIVSGRIVSKINTLTGSVSKLSVPEYCGTSAEKPQRDDRMYHIILAYQAGECHLKFMVQFGFPQNGGEFI